MNSEQVKILSERVVSEAFAQVFMPDRSGRENDLKIVTRDKLTEEELSRRLDLAIKISTEKLSVITFEIKTVEGEAQKADPYRPSIAWRRRLSNPPGRTPEEVDVHDGRAEYVLSGPYNLAEGSKIEVINGKLLFTGSSARVS